MRDDGGITGPFGHFNGIQGFGEGTDLVQFDQDGVGHAHFNALLQPFHVGDKQVIPNQLDFFAQGIGKLFPAVPVIFGQAVFNGNDGVFFAQGSVPFHHFGRSLHDPFPFQVVFAVFEQFAGSSIDGQPYLFTGFVAGFFDGFHNHLEGFFVAFQVGCKAPFIPYGRSQAFALQDFLQSLVDFRVDPQGFGEAVSPYGHDHEFLDVHVVVRMGTAVQDVHHGNRQFLGVDPAQILIQRQADGQSRSLGHSQGYPQDGVGTQTALVGGTVQTDHGFVDFHLTGGIQTDDGVGNGVIHIVHSLGDPFASETVLVPIPQFHGFVDPGGSTGRNSRTAYRAVIQQHIHFYRGIAPGIQDFSCAHVFNDWHCFHLVMVESGEQLPQTVTSH